MERKKVPGIGGRVATPPGDSRPLEADLRLRSDDAQQVDPPPRLPFLGRVVSGKTGRSGARFLRTGGQRSLPSLGRPFPSQFGPLSAVSPGPVAKRTPVRRGAKLQGSAGVFPSPHESSRSALCEINSHCGTLETLVALVSSEHTTQYELRRAVRSGYCAFEASLHCLMRLDLVRSECEPIFPFRLRYHLTESGRVLAQGLIAWERSALERRVRSPRTSGRNRRRSRRLPGGSAAPQ